jgi:hypothetical protein
MLPPCTIQPGCACESAIRPQGLSFDNKVGDFKATGTIHWMVPIDIKQYCHDPGLTRSLTDPSSDLIQL